MLNLASVSTSFLSIFRSDETPLDLTKSEQYNKSHPDNPNLASLYQAYMSKGQGKAEDTSRAALQAAALAASAQQPPFGLPNAGPALPFPFQGLPFHPEVAAFWLATQQQQELIRQKQQESQKAEQATLLSYLSSMQSLARSQAAMHYPQFGPSSALAAAAAAAASANSPGLVKAGKPEYNNNPAAASDSDSENYKMVIKNGVLMKKQKQRRYRTERPFKCKSPNLTFEPLCQITS